MGTNTNSVAKSPKKTPVEKARDSWDLGPAMKGPTFQSELKPDPVAPTGKQLWDKLKSRGRAKVPGGKKSSAYALGELVGGAVKQSLSIKADDPRPGVEPTLYDKIRYNATGKMPPLDPQGVAKMRMLHEADKKYEKLLATLARRRGEKL